jgi:glycosyltransferase involved in cell wall biosynthesis
MSSYHVPTWRRPIERKIVQQAHAICPVTINLQNALINHGYKGCYYPVPNVVDTESFNINNLPDKKKLSFIHISSLQDRSKNISGLLRSIKELSAIRDDFIFNFIGGDELEKHKSTATNLGIIDKYVFFHGEKKHEEIPALLNQNNVLVMFSHYESLPCVIIEALSCGLPVISSDVGGISEHIDSSRGTLVEAGNEEMLVNAFIRMIDSYKEYKKEDIRLYAVNHFSEKAVAQSFSVVYNHQ